MFIRVRILGRLVAGNNLARATLSFVYEHTGGVSSRFGASIAKVWSAPLEVRPIARALRNHRRIRPPARPCTGIGMGPRPISEWYITDNVLGGLHDGPIARGGVGVVGMWRGVGSSGVRE